MSTRTLTSSLDVTSRGEIPWSIPACAALLMLIGILSLTSPQFDLHATRPMKQGLWIAIALATMWIISSVPYQHLVRFAWPMYLAGLVLLCVVFTMPAINGSRRWIPIGPVSLQPSEFARLGFIVALASWLPDRDSYRRLTGLLLPFGVAAVPMLLILREPDLGTALCFAPVLFAMLFAAGARMRHLLLIMMLGLCSAPVFWQVMSAEQKSRVVTLFSQTNSDHAPQGDGYHLWQSRRAITSGGFWGADTIGSEGSADNKSSSSTHYPLPAAGTDFIFCVVGYRFGWWGCATVLAIELLLIFACLQVASRCNEPCGRLLPVGIGTLIATQTLINAGMTIGLMPITGLTLPLLSYGGSSLVSTAAGLGIVMSVHRHSGWQTNADPFLMT